MKQFLFLSGCLASIALIPSSNHFLQAPFDGSQMLNVISSGEVEYGDQAVRLGRPVPNSQGALWFSHPNTFAEWQVTLTFSIKGPEHGSDGLAFWYVRSPGKLGPVFGSADRWNGLGIFVDGFDNDGKGNNPAIMGVLNQGDISFRMDTDGEGQYFGGCVRQVRNTQHPVLMRITYVNKILKVEIDDAGRGKEEYMNCLERANTDLPLGYYFGVSAGAGQIPDEFSLHSFSLYELKKNDSGEIASKAEASKQTQSQNTNNAIAAASGNLEQLERMIKNMQSNLNAVMGSFQPGDRPVFKRLSDLEYSISFIYLFLRSSLAGLQEHVKALTDVVTKVLGRASSVDPAALLNTLNDIKSRTNQQLQALEDNARLVDKRTHHLVANTEKNSGFGLNLYIFFLVGQAVVLIGYHAVKGRLDKNKKYL